MSVADLYTVRFSDGRLTVQSSSLNLMYIIGSTLRDLLGQVEQHVFHQVLRQIS